MIVLFTDFGIAGPYVGQVKAVLFREAPGVPVVDLFHDAPVQRPDLAAYLLPAYMAPFKRGTVCMAVVDPGVGGKRKPLLMEVDGCWYVGPDNGLLDVLPHRAERVRRWRIDWRPPEMSNTFHGRDLFAPVAAHIATGRLPSYSKVPRHEYDPSPAEPDLAKVVYIDHYGNVIIGVRASRLPEGAVVSVGGRELARAKTYSDLPEGMAFWYENSAGLLELAINRGRADVDLNVRVGDPVSVPLLP
ncbi:MAG: SAM-dependent chlorinase/fluorinase [Chromatiales bacterium]|nr:SAM-dependent chlorinase/fluorinase [Chromatiales bacterium]